MRQVFPIKPNQTIKTPKQYLNTVKECVYNIFEIRHRVEFTIGIWPPPLPPPSPQEVNSCPDLENHYRPYMSYIFGKPWVQGTLWQCYGVSDMQIHKDKDKDKDKYTWAWK